MLAPAGAPLAIVSGRVLIGLLVPVTAAWLEHLIGCNSSRVHQGITEGEQAMAPGTPMTMLDELNRVRRAGVLAAKAGQGAARGVPPVRTGAQVGAELPFRTVDLRDLSAGLVERACEASQALAITSDRELIAIVIPVSRSLTRFLIDRNRCRVRYNIAIGERLLAMSSRLVTLAAVSEPA